MPKVSVIVPVFNGAPYLAECLDSILAQTADDFEVVCIDDGSTDATPEILASYAVRDGRLGWYSQENRGLSESRNRGIDLSSGAYLLFCDADDKLKPNAVRSLLEKAENDKLDVLLYGGETFFDDPELEKTQSGYKNLYASIRDFSSPRSGAALLHDLVAGDEYRSSACLQLIRRGHLETRGIRFLGGILHEDNLFTFTNLLSAKRVARVNDSWYLRRMHGGSIMTSPPGLRNAVGYAVCAREMFRFAQEHPQPPHIENACSKLVKSMIGACRRIMDGLSPEETARLEELHSLDRLWIDTLRRSRPESQFLRIKAKADRLEKQLKSTQRALDAIRRSATFRAGSALLFLPKTLYRLFKK